MIDEKLLNSLSTKEKEIFKKGLEDLIDQTYVIEEEYKKLNESYNSMQDLFLQIIEVQPNALWVLDKNGEIFLQNTEATDIQDLLKHVDTNKATSEVECNGMFYLVKVASHIEKTIISATDITEEKRSERLASMGQVAAHLSHEIRNPIGSISLLTSTLFKRVDTKSKPLVLEMQKAIWRVERMIKATLLFTKGLSPNFGYFSLESMAQECENAVEQYSYSSDIDFIYNFPDVQVYGDYELWVIVLQNFIFNAIDAIEECDDLGKHKVQFDYNSDEKYHYLSISDTGKAFENKNILFEPFKTTKTKGHGLGLSLSLQIIEAHKGSISLLEDKKGFLVQWSKEI